MSAFADPSPERLLHWLEHKPAKLERFLAAHPERAPVLDAELERLSALPEQAKQALSVALTVPVDLSERLRRNLHPGTGTEASAVVMDLLGLGLGTVKELFDDSPIPPAAPTP